MFTIHFASRKRWDPVGSNGTFVETDADGLDDQIFVPAQPNSPKRDFCDTITHERFQKPADAA